LRGKGEKKVKVVHKAVNKSKLARELGISRSSLYYVPKREGIDQQIKAQIESVMGDNPAYGHKRIALELKMDKKRIRRVMKKYNLKPYRRKARGLVKKEDRGKEASHHENLTEEHIKNKTILKPGQIWCTDFTYIKYEGKFIYVATIIDLYTREIVGVNISRYHNRFLVIGALQDAVKKNGGKGPEIIHSDQGSEYDSEDFEDYVKSINAQISMSKKGSPWENGYQESFYGHFKGESGDLSRFETIGELIEYIYQQLYYYNYKRIHSVLKMSPFQKKQSFYSSLTTV
jgi:transposase InsO family protein